MAARQWWDRKSLLLAPLVMRSPRLHRGASLLTMRPWLALFPAVLLASSLGCQRFPEEDPDDDPPPMGTVSDPGGGTLLPPDGDETDDSNADGTGSMNGCDPVAQIGCSPGEKCTALVTGGVIVYACVSDPAGLDPNSPCQPSHEDGIDGCPAGTACLGDESGNGLCAALCEANAQCEQAVCLAARESDIPYCAADCSPFESLCPAPTLCRRNADRFSCSFLDDGDVGGAGAPCGIADDAGCGPGFACLPGALVPDCGTDNCCAGLCDLSENDPCASPSTCNSILQAAAPGFEEIGACFVPA